MQIDRIAFQIGNLTIYWYGVFVAAGFLASLLVMQWHAKKQDIPSDRVSDICFAAMIGGVIGARILYVLSHFHEFRDNPIEIVRIDHGGLVFYGGLLGGTVGATWLVHRLGLRFWAIADLFAVGMPLGQAIGRIGCFINGCCFGKPSELPFAVPYLHGSPAWATQIHEGLISIDAQQCLPVFPTQPIQSGLNLVIWVIILSAAKKRMKEGQLFALYLMLYAGFRFLNEFTRGDYPHHPFGFTAAQLICMIVLPIGLIVFRRRSRYTVDNSKVIDNPHGLH